MCENSVPTATPTSPRRCPVILFWLHIREQFAAFWIRILRSVTSFIVSVVPSTVWVPGDATSSAESAFGDYF